MDLKGQQIRLLDVFALGPFMIWFGLNAKGMSELTKNIMIISGIGTILFNGRNFLIKKKGFK